MNSNQLNIMTPKTDLVKINNNNNNNSANNKGGLDL